MENYNKKYSINETKRISNQLIDPRYEFDAPRFFDFSKEYPDNTK